MKKEFIVTFTVSDQISQYEWVSRNPSMKIKPETTVAEIEEFYRKEYQNGRMEVKIIELSDV